VQAAAKPTNEGCAVRLSKKPAGCVTAADLVAASVPAAAATGLTLEFLLLRRLLWCLVLLL
jgi:hypothetical protein